MYEEGPPPLTCQYGRERPGGGVRQQTEFFTAAPPLGSIEPRDPLRPVKHIIAILNSPVTAALVAVVAQRLFPPREGRKGRSGANRSPGAKRGKAGKGRRR